MRSYLAPFSLCCDQEKTQQQSPSSTPRPMVWKLQTMPCLSVWKHQFSHQKQNKNPLDSRPSLKSFSTKLNLKERALSDCRLARTCSTELVCRYLGRILFQSLRTTWVITVSSSHGGTQCNGDHWFIWGEEWSSWILVATYQVHFDTHHCFFQLFSFFNCSTVYYF